VWLHSDDRNALPGDHAREWEADRKGYPRPLRLAIRAAREYGLRDDQIAGELMTTPEKVDELGRDPEPPDPSA
jgi:hypothetical protein